MRPACWLLRAAGAALVMGALSAAPAEAQVPARFYWKSLSGANAVPVIINSMSGNTNPFDPAQTVTAGADFDATLVVGGYARTFTLKDRAALVAVLLPMGRISGDVNFAGTTASQSARGFGDPMIEFDFNILGPKAQKSLPDVLRYEPGFSLDVMADLALPIGEYDSSQSLNIGQNRWYGRVGFPIVWQLGAWVPGRRTTLELLPAAWFFSDNDDYTGQELKTDTMFEVDFHLTRDFTEHAWAAFDAAWYTGGKPTVNGVEGKALGNLGVGLTFGYQINDNLGLTLGYKSTIDDGAPDDLRMDGFLVSLAYGWHPIIEGSRRLQSE